MNSNTKDLYIVAKQFGKRGSIAYTSSSSVDSSKLPIMFEYINKEASTLNTNVEVVLIRGIESYKEYYPLTTISDSKDFMIQVLVMMKGNKI